MQLHEIITFVCSIIGTSGVISGIVLRKIDKLHRMLESKEADRIKESVISGEALEMTAKLTEANTWAIRTITTEDACSEELESFRTAFEKLEHFMREKSAQYLHAN